MIMFYHFYLIWLVKTLLYCGFYFLYLVTFKSMYRNPCPFCIEINS